MLKHFKNRVQVSVPEGQRRGVGCGGAPVELKKIDVPFINPKPLVILMNKFGG